MSLLGFMAAGAAIEYGKMREQEVSKLNELRTAVFSAEIQNAFNQRLQEMKGLQREALDLRKREWQVEDLKEKRDLKLEEETRKDARLHEREKGLDKRHQALLATKKEIAQMRREPTAVGKKEDDPFVWATKREDLVKQKKNLQKELDALGPPSMRKLYPERSETLTREIDRVHREIGTVEEILKEKARPLLR